MRRLYWILFTLCFLTLASAWAEEKETPQPPVAVPDPIELRTNWWEYFEKAGESLPERSEALIEQLQTAAAKLTPENRQVATEVITKIQSSLQSYEKIITTPPPQKVPPTTIADAYTIDQLITIQNNILRQSVEIRSNLVQQEDEKRTIESTRQYLTTLRSRYSAAETRSEQKFLVGLDILLYNINLRVSNRNLKYLEATYTIDQEEQKRLQEELNIAKQRLVSTIEEQRRLESEMRQSRGRWQMQRENLQRIQTSSDAVVTATLGRKEEIEKQVNLTHTREATIREAIAYNAYLLATLKYNLSSVLNEPGDIDASELDSSIDDWEQQLFDLDRKEQDWTKRTEQTLAQYSQILSLNAEDIRDVESQIRQIVQNAQNNLLLTQQLDNELDDSFFVLQVLDQRVTGLISVYRLYLLKIGQAAKVTLTSAAEWLNVSLLEIGPDRFITFASILRFIIIIFIAIWIARITRRGLRTLAKTRKGIRKSLIYRISRLFQYVIFAVALLVGFSTLGFDFGNFLIVLGALGVGLGFGLQSIFNNFISGIIILFESQLKVGDYVELEEEGLRGEIREINVRNTLIVTNDGTDVLIPNSQIVSNRIINWTLREPYRRVHVPFSVAYGTDKELVKEVVLEAAKSVPNTLIRPGVPEPRVYLSKFADSGMEFELVVWVDEPSTRRQRNTRSAYLWAIDTAFRKHDIEIPFPQRDVHIKE